MYSHVINHPWCSTRWSVVIWAVNCSLLREGHGESSKNGPLRGTRTELGKTERLARRRLVMCCDHSECREIESEFGLHRARDTCARQHLGTDQPPGFEWKRADCSLGEPLQNTTPHPFTSHGSASREDGW